MIFQETMPKFYPTTIAHVSTDHTSHASYSSEDSDADAKIDELEEGERERVQVDHHQALILFAQSLD